LTDKDRILLEYYNCIIEELFGVKGTIRPYSSKRSYKLRASAYILKYIQNISTSILCKSKKREIPKLIFDLTDKEIASFLRGLYDAEGTLGNHSIDFCSSSLYLIQQVRALLLRLGIKSQIYRNLLEKKKNKYRHKLFIYGEANITKFYLNIGFCSKKKQDKLSNYFKKIKKSKSSSFADYLPLKNYIRALMESFNIKMADLPPRLRYHLNSSSSNVTLRRSNVLEISNILEKKGVTKKALALIRKHINSDICWQPIKSNNVVDANTSYVYDLTVPKYENYIAEGVIVHNSPWPNKLGREFNTFKVKEISFEEIVKALKRENGRKCVLNVGFNPLEGKYHKTRCTGCLSFFDPKEAEKLRWRCYECGKPVKKGVDFRIEELADLPPGNHPEHRPEYKHIIPLSEIIALALNINNTWSVKVQNIWKEFVGKFENEINILLNVGIDDLSKVNHRVAEYVGFFREEKIKYIPGGAGIYGKLVKPGEEVKINKIKVGQKSLSDFYPK
jgi:hypothetical protein